MNDNLNKNRNGLPSSSSPHKSSITQPVVIQESQKRSTTGLWATIIILFLALVGVTGYGYLALQEHNIQLSQLPGVEESVTLLSGQVATAKEQFQEWGERWNVLEGRLDKLEGRTRQARAQARKDAQEMVAQLQGRIQEEMQQRDQALEARFNQIESAQQKDQFQMADLREGITQARRDAGSDVSLLHQQVARGERNLEALAQQLETRRIDFELAKNNTRELAPGVSVRITKTDVRRQEVDGWLWLMPDRRTLWVRDLGLLQPLVFYHEDSEQPNELVITRVTQNSIIGYVQLPAGSEVSFGASAGANRRNPFAPGEQVTSESGTL